jgi:hypothetical protein
MRSARESLVDRRSRERAQVDRSFYNVRMLREALRVGFACGTVAFVVSCGRIGYDAPADANPSDGVTSDAADGSTDQGPPSSCPPRTAIEVAISSDRDDGELEPTMLWPQGEPSATGAAPGIAMGWSNGHSVWGFFRFQLPMAIASGAAILPATLHLDGIDAPNWDPSMMALVIAIEDIDDAGPVISQMDDPDNRNGRPLLTTTVRWPASGGLSWNLLTTNDSPDVSSLLVALAQRHGGLQAGAHVQFWIRGESSGTNAKLTTPDIGRTIGVVARFGMQVCP